MNCLYRCRRDDFNSWANYTSISARTKPNIILRLSLLCSVGVVAFIVIVVVIVSRHQLRLRYAQMTLDRPRRNELASGGGGVGGGGGLRGGGGIVIFCADVDAADADRMLATPLRLEGVNVKLEHAFDWNLEDAAVADAVATAVNHADAVIFVLSVDYLVGSGSGGEGGGGGAARGLQDKTAR